MKLQGPKIIAGISLVLWITACTLPAYNSYGFGSGIPGWECALFGPFALLGGNLLAYIAWSGNAFAVYSLILLFKSRYPLAKRMAMIAVVCSLAAFLVGGINGPDTVTVIKFVSFGAYVWAASITTVLIGAVILQRTARKNSRNQIKQRR